MTGIIGDMANEAFVFEIAGDHDGDGIITKNEMKDAWAYGLTECMNALKIHKIMASTMDNLGVYDINLQEFMEWMAMIKKMLDG
jgi:Ca2+-binding EF-hand superfamily protein